MFWAFGIAAILLLAYFISAMACGWGWEKCGKKSSSSTNDSNESAKRFLIEMTDISPDRLLLS